MAFEASRFARWMALATFVAAAGCGGGSGGGSSGGTGGSSSGGGTAGSYGMVTVSVVPPAGTNAGYTALAGKIYDGAYPETVSWTQTAAGGGCVLYTPATPLCTPACGTGYACVATNTCQAYPSTLSAGALTVTGVGSSALTVNPISGSYSTTTAEYPPFAEGATVRVAAAGATSGSDAFTVTAKGVAPLATTGSAAIAKDGAGYGPLALAWTAGDSSVATIVVKVDLSHHGGSKGKIECAAADTGSLTIPASLVTSLVGLGVYAAPKVDVTRRATGSVTVGTGSVKLQIDSLKSLPVTIEGVTCGADAECASNSCDLTSSLRYGLCN